MRHRLVSSCCALAAALLLSAPHARAEDIAIGWQAPDSCGNREDFEAGVARIVGRPSAELDSAWTSADVIITPTEGGFRLRVRVLSRSGRPRQRELIAATCAEARKAAELIVATSLSEPEPPPPEPEPLPAVPKPPPSPAPPPRLESSAATERRWRGLLGARVGLEPWLVPSPMVMGWVMLGIESEPLRLELMGGVTSHEAKEIAGGGSVVASLLVSQLVGCYTTPSRSFRAGLCAGAEAGRFRAEGESGANLVRPRKSDNLWAGVLLQSELSVSLTQNLALSFGVQGVLSLRPVKIVQTASQVSETTEIYATSRADARPWLGVEGRF